MRRGPILAGLAVAAALGSVALFAPPREPLVDGCPALNPAGRDGYGGYAPVPRADGPLDRLRRRLAGEADWAGLCWYRDANARLVARGEPVRTVFFGDSMLALWRGFDAGLFRDGRINRGVPSQTSAHLMARIGPDVLALDPATVHILVGMNEALGQYPAVRDEDFAANLASMVRLARARGIAVVVGTIPPPGAAEATGERGDPRARIARLNALIRRIAAEQGAIVADYHTAMAGTDGLARAGLIQPDTIHPTTAGYAVMRDVIEPALATAQGAAQGR